MDQVYSLRMLGRGISDIPSTSTCGSSTLTTRSPGHVDCAEQRNDINHVCPSILDVVFIRSRTCNEHGPLGYSIRMTFVWTCDAIIS